ncbi:MAG: transposase [Moraxellaceae bacterium]|nr:transposase [Moraxellaceae bacterium]
MIKGGLASARLLAWIIVSKFADHLPLYRLEQIAARQQVPFYRVLPYPHGLAWWVMP